LLLHPAAGSTVTEGSVLLHHTYGVPYVPGSALRGVVRAWVRSLPQKPGRMKTTKPSVDLLFGYTEEGERGGQAGFFDFWDALWVPESPAKVRADWSPLARDIVNPHQSEYYTGEANSPDVREDPVPTENLTVRPGTKFFGAIEFRSTSDAVLAPWLEWLKNSLADAVKLRGAGAKTRAGYGRLELTEWWPAGEKPRAVVRKAGSGPSAALSSGSAFVRYRPDSGELSARLDDGRTAFVAGEQAKALLADLSKSFVKKLQGGARARVEWSAKGNHLTLISIQRE
jgi:CRISPR-associated protein Cmr6